MPTTTTRIAVPAPSGVAAGRARHLHGNLVAALAGGALGLFVLGCAMPESHPDASLFKRVGGMPTMTALADRVVDAVAVDVAGGNAFTATDLPSVKRDFALHLCARAGGACRHAGEGTRRPLDGLRLTERQFERVVSAMRRALEGQVGERDKNDMLRLLAPMKRGIAGA